MFDTYKELFDRYLKEVNRYAKTMPYVSVAMCNMRSEQLRGMLNLLFHANAITHGQWGIECEQIKNAFDSKKICGAYQTSGEIHECSAGGKIYEEK